MNERERLESESLLQTSLDCYLAAIQMFQKHAIPTSPEALLEYRQKLGNMHRDLFADVSIQGLEDSRAELDHYVEAYAANVIQHYREAEQEVKQIIALLQDATGALTDRNEKYGGEFRNFAAQLEQTSKCEDLRQISVQLSLQVSKIRNCADNFRNESAAALKPIEQELKSVEERLKHAEHMASTDSLTELFNRREGERRAQERIVAGRVFCLLVLDLNRFKWINDRYGHHAGDQVL